MISALWHTSIHCWKSDLFSVQYLNSSVWFWKPIPAINRTVSEPPSRIYTFCHQMAVFWNLSSIQTDKVTKKYGFETYLLTNSATRRFGGEPVRVAVPPTLDEYATARQSILEKSFSFLSSSGSLSSACSSPLTISSVSISVDRACSVDPTGYSLSPASNIPVYIYICNKW